MLFLRVEIMLPFYVFLALLGLAVGSFLGMLTYRLPRGLSFSGRSLCPHCKAKIRWFENIPVLSFVFLWGKCARCGKRISWRYPLIETAAAGLFTAAGVFWENIGPQNSIAYSAKQELGTFSLVFFLIILTLGIALFVIDLEFQILPDSLVLTLGLITLILILSLPSPLLFHHLLAGALSSFFFLLLYLATRGRGMGFGDVKLSFVLGSLLGYPESLVWLFLAFLTGGLVGAILILAKKARFGQHISFGPFLLLSGVVAFGFGEILLKWYLTLL